MNDPKRPPMLAADHIRELTQHHVTRDRVDRFVPVPNVLTEFEGADLDGGWSVPRWTRIKETHETHYAPLLEQLEEAVHQSPEAGAHGGGTPKSKPSARLDALAVLQRIDRQSRARAADLNIEPAQLPARLLAISGKVGATLDEQVRAWWVAARCATGWEQHPYAPDVPCPNVECERWSTLRIRLDDYLASCVECGEVWDRGNYVQLGDYVRWASEHLRGARHWLYDAEGYPVECVECLPEREAMAKRLLQRAAQERAARKVAKVS